MSESEDVESFMKEIETGMVIEELEKRGHFALCIAQIAGAVHRAALESGVPYNLATEMAQDYWNSEMIPVEVMVSGNEEID